MRKIILNTFFSFSILMAGAGGSVYANPTVCPPAAVIKATKLTNLIGLSFYSKPMIFNGDDWNVWMGSEEIAEDVLNAKTKAEALKIGQDYFDKTPLDINNPIPQTDTDGTVCSYVTANNGFYVVHAKSPALYIDL